MRYVDETETGGYVRDALDEHDNPLVVLFVCLLPLIAYFAFYRRR